MVTTMASSDPEFSRDVNPETKRKIDPLWIPSDAEMIDWVERGYTVRPYMSDDLWGWSVRGVRLFGEPLGVGKSWRAAVEDAMRKQMES